MKVSIDFINSTEEYIISLKEQKEKTSMLQKSFGLIFDSKN